MVDTTELRKEIGIPSFVDASPFGMRKVIAILYLSLHPGKVAVNYHSDRIGIAVFGGLGFKLHCPSSNKLGPFHRKTKDIDLITSVEHGEGLVKILTNMDRKCGNMYTSWTTSGDDIFNTMRGRRRYRVHTVQETDEAGTPIAGIMDIFCGEFRMCHVIDLGAEIDRSPQNCFTIGLENLILSKAQAIMNVDRKHVSALDDLRVLCEWDKDRVLLGMEPKDIQDLSSLLYDHEFGKDADSIDLDKLGQKVKRDWGLWNTVTLNLRNMYQKWNQISAPWNVSEEETKTIREKLVTVLDCLDKDYSAKKSRFSFSKQWWKDVEGQLHD